MAKENHYDNVLPEDSKAETKPAPSEDKGQEKDTADMYSNLSPTPSKEEKMEEGEEIIEDHPLAQRNESRPSDPDGLYEKPRKLPEIPPLDEAAASGSGPSSRRTPSHGSQSQSRHSRQQSPATGAPALNVETGSRGSRSEVQSESSQGGREERGESEQAVKIPIPQSNLALGVEAEGEVIVPMVPRPQLEVMALKHPRVILLGVFSALIFAAWVAVVQSSNYPSYAVFTPEFPAFVGLAISLNVIAFAMLVAYIFYGRFTFNRVIALMDFAGSTLAVLLLVGINIAFTHSVAEANDDGIFIAGQGLVTSHPGLTTGAVFGWLAWGSLVVRMWFMFYEGRRMPKPPTIKLPTIQNPNGQATVSRGTSRNTRFAYGYGVPDPEQIEPTYESSYVYQSEVAASSVEPTYQGQDSIEPTYQGHSSVAEESARSSGARDPPSVQIDENEEDEGPYQASSTVTESVY
eukprot:Clim_evm5s90 gene=Clim_evmTU5s90